MRSKRPMRHRDRSQLALCRATKGAASQAAEKFGGGQEEPRLDSRYFAPIVSARNETSQLLVKDVWPEFSHDLDYLVSMLDWDANVNPEFAKSNKTKPRPIKAIEEMESEVIANSGSPMVRPITPPRSSRCYPNEA